MAQSAKYSGVNQKIICVPKPGALNPGRTWPVASKVPRDRVFICSMSGTDTNVFKPEGLQCWVCGFFASLIAPHRFDNERKVCC